MISLFEQLHDISEDATKSRFNGIFYMAVSHMLGAAALGHKYCYIMEESLPFEVTKRDLNKVRKALKSQGLQVTKLLGSYNHYFMVGWEDNADLES